MQLGIFSKTLVRDTSAEAFDAVAAHGLTCVQFNFETVGIELDPVSGLLYACTRNDLVSIDPVTGDVTIVGNIYQDPSCDDLGATYLNSPCLELP